MPHVAARLRLGGRPLPGFGQPGVSAVDPAGLCLGRAGHPGGVGVLRCGAGRAAGHRHDGGSGLDRGCVGSAVSAAQAVDRVLTGGVRAWQARKIAEQTRPLSWEACADVDHALSDFVGMMPWPRFAKILSATILEADPALAAERAERARAAQDVFSFDSEDGLKTIVAKADAGDAIWFLATVNRIADILAAAATPIPWGPAGPRSRDFGPTGRGAATVDRAPQRLAARPPSPTKQANPTSQRNQTPQTHQPSQANPASRQTPTP